MIKQKSYILKLVKEVLIQKVSLKMFGLHEESAWKKKKKKKKTFICCSTHGFTIELMHVSFIFHGKKGTENI